MLKSSKGKGKRRRVSLRQAQIDKNRDTMSLSKGIRGSVFDRLRGTIRKGKEQS
jgi:hypothetical protein